MSDITSCTGDKCDKKESCLRYTQEEAPWQSYFHMPFNVVGEDQVCDYFVPNKDKE